MSSEAGLKGSSGEWLGKGVCVQSLWGQGKHCSPLPCVCHVPPCGCQRPRGEGLLFTSLDLSLPSTF